VFAAITNSWKPCWIRHTLSTNHWADGFRMTGGQSYSGPRGSVLITRGAVGSMPIYPKANWQDTNSGGRHQTTQAIQDDHITVCKVSRCQPAYRTQLGTRKRQAQYATTLPGCAYAGGRIYAGASQGKIKVGSIETSIQCVKWKALPLESCRWSRRGPIVVFWLMVPGWSQTRSGS
jgi:hypothetical protein